MAEKTHYTIPEFKQALAKTIRDRVDAHALELRELAKRELSKSAQLGGGHMEPGVHEAEQPGVAAHMEPGGHEQFSMSGPQPEHTGAVGSSAGLSAMGDTCPLCSKPDMPGQCMCLSAHQAPPVMKSEADLKKYIPAGYRYPPAPKIQPKPAAAETKPPEVKKDEPVGTAPMELSENCSKCGKPQHEKTECGPEMVKSVPDPTVKGAVLPDDKKPKELKAPGSGDVTAPVAKSDVPMAKPPSGKNMATATPVSSNTSKPPAVQKKEVTLPGSKLSKALPHLGGKDQASMHMSAAAAKAPGAPAPAAPKLPTPAAHAQRAADFGAFMPAGNVGNPAVAPKLPGAGLGLKGPPAAAKESLAPIAAKAPPKLPGMGASKSAGPVLNAARPPKPGLFGKNEKCPFCKLSEHRGDCSKK